MTDPRLDPLHPAAAAWYRAATFEERIEGAPTGDPDALARGQERVDSWVGDGGITLDTAERWISDRGVPREQVLAVLGETDDAVAARLAAGAPPTWLTALCADLAEAAVRTGTMGSEAIAPWRDAPDGADALTLVDPFVAAALARTARRLVQIDAVVDLGELVLPLRRRLLALVERTAVLELRIADMRGELPGDATPEQKYAAFIDLLSTPDRRAALLQEYAVLARTAHHWVQCWESAAVELVSAIAADRSALATTFGLPARGPLKLEAADSDPHRGGRHVWIVSGSGTRVVFKPRPGAAEAGFQRVVQGIDDLGLEPPLRVLAVVERPDHVWVEFVEARPAATAADVVAFHRRQGAWLVVQWLLACSDVHWENVLAAGEHPVPIDHETMLRSRMFDPGLGDADLAAEVALAETVYGVDLLPSPRPTGPGGAFSVDQSGMGDGYAASGEIVVDQVVGGARAGARVAPTAIMPDTQPNRASLDGRPVDPRDHALDVEQGMRDAWAVVRANGPSVRALVESCRDALVRVILRPTQSYLDVLRDLGHPQYLQHALEAEHAVLQLWRFPASQAWRGASVDCERRQVLAGDVPWFGTGSGSSGIVGGDGAELPGMVVRTGIDVALARVDEVAGDDAGTAIEPHLWVARASLARQWSTDPPIAGSPLAGDGTASGDLDAGTAADLVAARLRDLAVRAAGTGASWLTAEMVPGEPGGPPRFRPERVDSGLYDGLPGIAVALAAHGRARGDAASTELALEAAATLRDRLEDPHASIGAYDGAAGRARAWLQLAELLGDDALVDDAEQAVAAVATGFAHDRVHDVISGGAGCVAVLIELSAHRPAALDLAANVGERLVAAVRSPDDLPFARGFSHGPTGVAWALALLARATSDDRFLAHAHKLVRAEDELLAGGAFTDRPPHLAAWCHGAPGIALGRAAIARAAGDDAWWSAPVSQAAADATLAAPAHDTHALCHGEMGTAEVLLLLHDLTGDVRFARNAEQRTAAVLAEMAAGGPRCTTPRRLETPGLMTGLAGICTALLRAHDPAAAPAVLLPAHR